MASTQPNAARLKTANDFKRSEFGGSEFGRSPLRALLYALYEVEREVDVDEARAHLRDLISDKYYRRRDDLVEMASYIARKRGSLVPQEAEAARVLAARIRSERLGE
jgi:putative DNA methylase